MAPGPAFKRRLPSETITASRTSLLAPAHTPRTTKRIPSSSMTGLDGLRRGIKYYRQPHRALQDAMRHRRVCADALLADARVMIAGQYNHATASHSVGPHRRAPGTSSFRDRARPSRCSAESRLPGTLPAYIAEHCVDGLSPLHNRQMEPGLTQAAWAEQRDSRSRLCHRIRTAGNYLSPTA